MALIDGLVSYWTLDEGSASDTRLDSHGANDLAPVNNPSVSPGPKLGAGAVVCDADASTPKYLAIASPTGLQGGNRDFTVAGWVYLGSVGGEQVICSRWNNGLGDREYLLEHDGAGNYLWLVRRADDSGNASVSASYNTSATWHWVCVWHDAAADEIGIQVNAGSPVTASLSGGTRTSSQPFELGGNVGAPAAGLDLGIVDEWGFFDVALDSGERAELYNGGSGLAYPFSSGVTLTPVPASAISSSATPTVVHGAISLTPTVASALAATQPPTVSLPILLTPGPASAGAASGAPDVAQGPLTLSPPQASARAGRVDPVVTLGALTLSPPPVSARAARGDPTVSQGPVTLTPAPVSALAHSQAPTVSHGPLTLSPTPASAFAQSQAPTVLLGSVTPDPASARAQSQAPTVILGPVTLSPAAASALARTQAPAVSHGPVTLTPAPASAGTMSSALFAGGTTLSPTAATARSATAAPAVTLGALTLTALASAIARTMPPHLAGDGITLTPPPASLQASTAGPQAFVGTVIARGSMPAALYRLLTQTLLYAPVTVIDHYGQASYGPDVALKARISGKSQFTRDSQGRDVLATTVAWVATTAVIHTEDRITLPDGSRPHLLRVERYLDERGRLHHQQLYFG